MINFLTVNENTIEALDAQIAKAKETVRLAQIKRDLFTETTSAVSLSAINECFAKLKLEATVDNISQSGETEAELKTRDIMIAIRAVPMEKSSVKPVVFNGYTSGGSSRNGKERRERTLRLAEKITELTGYKCHINEFSMEVKSRGDACRIMIDLVIPNPYK